MMILSVCLAVLATAALGLAGFVIWVGGRDHKATLRAFNGAHRAMLAAILAKQLDDPRVGAAVGQMLAKETEPPRPQEPVEMREVDPNAVEMESHLV